MDVHPDRETGHDERDAIDLSGAWIAPAVIADENVRGSSRSQPKIGELSWKDAGDPVWLAEDREVVTNGRVAARVSSTPVAVADDKTSRFRPDESTSQLERNPQHRQEVSRDPDVANDGRTIVCLNQQWLGASPKKHPKARPTDTFMQARERVPRLSDTTHGA